MMNQRWMLVLVAGLFLGSAIKSQPPSTTPVDLLGDPLPNGAIARLGTTRFKHDPATGRYVNTVAFSPDGKRIVSISGLHASNLNMNLNIRLWDAATGRQLSGPWSADNIQYSAVAFSPDSTVLAAVAGPIAGQLKRSMKTEIILWHIATAKALQTVQAGKDCIQTLVFVDGGKTLIGAGDGAVRWWDVAQAKEQRIWRPFGEENKPTNGKGATARSFRNCTLSPDGKFLTIETGPGVPFEVDDGDRAEVKPIETHTTGFDLATGKVTWETTGKDSNRNSLGFDARIAYTADGRRVAVADSSEQVTIRDPAKGRFIATAQFPKTDPKWLALLIRGNANGSLAMSANGTTIAMCSNGGPVTLWSQHDPSAFRVVPQVGRSDTFASAVAFSPDGKQLVVAVGTVLKVLDVATLKEVHAVVGHESAVDFIAFSANGKRVLTVSLPSPLGTSSTWTWDTSNWKPASPLAKNAVGLPDNGVVCPDQTRYVGLADKKRFGVYDRATGKLLTALGEPGSYNPNARMVFSPDSKYLVLYSLNDPGKIIEQLYSLATGKLLCVLPFAPDPRRALAFSADGRLIAVLTLDDALIHTYDISTGKLLHRMGTQPKGPQLTSLCNLAFTPDGRLLASWQLDDMVVRVWDVDTGKQRLFLPSDGKKQEFPCLAWSPDSRTLVVAGRKTIKLWELATLKVRCEFTGYDGEIRALAFSPDGRYLASGSSDTTALVWDTWLAKAPSP